MPVKTEFSGAVEKLRVGDELPALSGDQTVPVERVDVAVKWVKVLLADGQKLSLRKGASIEFLRVVPTEEEKAADEREFAQKTTIWAAKRAWEQFDRLRQKLAQELLFGYSPSDALAWDAEKLMEAEATWGWWARVLLSTGEEGTGEDGMDIAQAHAAVAEEARKEVLRFHNSRSTSPARNMQEDAKHMATINFATSRW